MTEGIRISKGMLAFITFLILLLGSIVSLVTYASGISSTVDENSHTLRTVEPKVYENEKDIAVIKAHYRTIDSNLDEIKTLLKDK